MKVEGQLQLATPSRWRRRRRPILDQEHAPQQLEAHVGAAERQARVRPELVELGLEACCRVMPNFVLGHLPGRAGAGRLFRG